MISVRRAFTSLTTTSIILQHSVDGSYDLNNVWSDGGYTEPAILQATPLPYGNRDDGILGEQLSATTIGERQPAYMQVASPERVDINSYLTIDGIVYKTIREGSYYAAGYWSTLGERVDNKEFEVLGYAATPEGIIKI